uniref:Uncharacterized protein n=1 Tax=Vertebrata australis TaxID=1967852 RepID=A0A1Z1MIQ6_9FLOR|nr:hypothetical protein [Vertebrata australis]ARW65769.1 hypothetical protein [Vertebrata australis]
MSSDMKNIYYEKNIKLSDYYFTDNKQDIYESIDMSIGWSVVCLNETINYYVENINRKN